MIRIFIIHGWDGAPDKDWLPWLTQELRGRGFICDVPAMPSPDAPEIGAWVSTLTNAVGTADAETFFVGHSIGCQAIMRYMEKLSPAQKIGGAIFVAPWLTLTNLEDDAARTIAAPWLETPIDFSKIKLHTKNFTAIFSDNDPFVPTENQKFFATRLDAHIIVEHNRGHFTADDGVHELLSVRNALQNFF